MKILSAKEVEKVEIKQGRRGSANTVIYLKVGKLKVGEALLVPKTEWKAKSAPYSLLSPWQKGRELANKKFSCRQTENNEWLIIRTK